MVLADPDAMTRFSGAKPELLHCPKNYLIMKKIVFAVFAASLVLAACGGSAPAPAPASNATMAPLNPKAAGLPATGDISKIVAALPKGDANNGKTLFTTLGCQACHSLEKDMTLVGPSYYGVFTAAATRVPGMGAKEYIYESIVNPNKFVVSKFQPNLMTQTYAQTMTPQEAADILAWMERDLK